MPQLGESIAEATVLRSYVAVGDFINAESDVIEVETNKATMSVNSLCSGTLVELLVKEGESCAVGGILAVLEVSEQELERTGEVAIDGPQSPSLHPENEGVKKDDDSTLHFRVEGEGYREKIEIEPNVQGLPVPVGSGGAHYISPRMRARMHELGLRAADISAICGTGAGGRVTVEDLEHFLQRLESWPRSKASSMRRGVADSMRRSWTRPLATVSRPIILEPVLAHRKKLEKKPGLTLYFLRALALAIADNPRVAGFLVGENIVEPRSIDIGVAVQVDDGVFVPVLREVDRKKLNDLVDTYQSLVERTRRRHLEEKETTQGIATVTNFGTFGLRNGTPIPLPNETLILGIGSGSKRPVWSEEVGVFLPIMEAEMALTFDHRVVDGGDAGRLLERVAQLLAHPEHL